MGKFGIHTTRKRLIQVQRELKKEGKDFRAFEVLNLGRYERQAYLNVGGKLRGKKKEEALARKEQEFRDLILKAYKAEPLPDTAFFHGKQGGRLVVVGPINLPVGRLFVEEVITECRKRQATRVDVLAFEFEMGLFPAVLKESKDSSSGEFLEFEERWTGAYIFENEWQSFRTRRDRDLDLTTASHTYTKPGRYTVAVKVIDIFGNDTMTLVPVNVG